jgi:formate dehydrogenase subunit gamma
MAEARTVERFRKRTVWFHWIHTAAFLTLLVTGAILFFPGLGGAAAGGATRFIHRIAVVVFVGVPLIYVAINPRMSWHFIKETFTWGSDDYRWVLRAPDYYFGGAEEKMLPQGHVNTGQKAWQLIVVVTGVIFLVSGALMLSNSLGPAVFRWAVIAHDVAFIVALLMFLVHIYLGVIHPRMTESLRSMLDGKISRKYARSHYGRWYEEMAAKKK